MASFIKGVKALKNTVISALETVDAQAEKASETVEVPATTESPKIPSTPQVSSVSTLPPTRTEYDRSRHREKALEAQVTDLYEELRESRALVDNLRARLSSAGDGRVEDLEGELQLSNRRLQALEADYENARVSHAAALSASRAEVARAEAALEAGLVEAMTLRVSSTRTMEELLAENARLGAALAAAQAAVEAKGEGEREASGIGKRESALTAQLAEARNAASICTAQLAAEGRRLAESQAALEAAQRHSTKWREAAESSAREITSLRHRSSDTVATLEGEVKELRERLRNFEVTLPTTKEQLRSVTGRLAASEESRARLSAECSALRGQLEGERVASAAAAAELVELKAREAEGLDEDMDPEVGLLGGRGAGSREEVVSRGGVAESAASSTSQRLRRASKPVNMQLTPMSRINAFSQNKNLAGVANALDLFTSWSARSLLKRPTVRLIFLVWIALLHLGTGWLILFHVHGLQHDKHVSGPGGHIPH